MGKLVNCVLMFRKGTTPIPYNIENSLTATVLEAKRNSRRSILDIGGQPERKISVLFYGLTVKTEF